MMRLSWRLFVVICKINRLLFYFPGHRGRSFDSDLLNTLSTSFLQADLPELPGIEEAIDRAQILAAESVGADHSWFLTNGATIGVQAMFLAFAGAKVLVGRNCHRSALGGDDSGRYQTSLFTDRD